MLSFAFLLLELFLCSNLVPFICRQASAWVTHVLAGTTLVIATDVVPALRYVFLKSMILSIASSLRLIFSSPWPSHRLPNTLHYTSIPSLLSDKNLFMSFLIFLFEHNTSRLPPFPSSWNDILTLLIAMYFFKFEDTFLAASGASSALVACTCNVFVIHTNADSDFWPHVEDRSHGVLHHLCLYGPSSFHQASRS